MTLEEQLEKLQIEIDEHTETLKVLKSKKKEILKKIEDKEKRRCVSGLFRFRENFRRFKNIVDRKPAPEWGTGSK